MNGCCPVFKNTSQENDRNPFSADGINREANDEREPKNIIPEKIKACRADNGRQCAYYYRLSYVTSHYAANEGLCLYGYKKK